MTQKVKMHAKNVNNEYVQVHPETVASQVIVNDDGKSLDQVLTNDIVNKENLGSIDNPNIIDENTLLVTVHLPFTTSVEATAIVERIDVCIPSGILPYTVDIEYELSSVFAFGASHGIIHGRITPVVHGDSGEVLTKDGHIVYADGQMLKDSFRIGSFTRDVDNGMYILPVYKVRGANNANFRAKITTYFNSVGVRESIKNIVVRPPVMIDPSELPPKTIPISELAVIESDINENGQYIKYADGRVEMEIVKMEPIEVQRQVDVDTRIFTCKLIAPTAIIPSTAVVVGNLAASLTPNGGWVKNISIINVELDGTIKVAVLPDEEISLINGLRILIKGRWK